MQPSSIKPTDLPFPFLKLPLEVKVIILSFLEKKTLLVFEQVSKSVAPFVNETWRMYNKNPAGFKFKWLACAKDNCPEKWEPRLTRALIDYLNFKIDLLDLIFLDDRSKVKLKDTCIYYLKFKNIIERYPSFGAYIRLDLVEDIYQNAFLQFANLSNLANSNPSNKSRQQTLINKIEKLGMFKYLPPDFRSYVKAYLLARHQSHVLSKPLDTLQKMISNPENPLENVSTILKDFNERKMICQISSEEEKCFEGGEWFLRALFNIHEATPKKSKDLKEGIQYLLKAIEKQATCVSLLAYNLIYKRCLHKEMAIQWYEPLAVLSAEQGDHSGLIKLAYMKLQAKKWEEAESLYEDLLKNIRPEKENIGNEYIHGMDLLELTYHLTTTKIKLTKWKEAERLFTENLILLLEMINQAISSGMDIADVYVFHKKLEEDLTTEKFVDIFATFAPKIVQEVDQMRLVTTMNFSFTNFLFNGLLAKVELEKWEDACPLYYCLLFAFRITLKLNDDEFPDPVKDLFNSIRDRMEQIGKEFSERETKRARYN